VLAAARERNSQTVAKNHRPDRMGDLLMLCLWGRFQSGRASTS
jgi:hypothetical protein